MVLRAPIKKSSMFHRIVSVASIFLTRVASFFRFSWHVDAFERYYSTFLIKWGPEPFLACYFFAIKWEFDKMGTDFQKNSEIAAKSKHFPYTFRKKLNIFLCNFFAIKWGRFSEFIAILEQNGNPFYQERTVSMV